MLRVTQVVVVSPSSGASEGSFPAVLLRRMMSGGKFQKECRKRGQNKREREKKHVKQRVVINDKDTSSLSIGLVCVLLPFLMVLYLCREKVPETS